MISHRKKAEKALTNDLTADQWESCKKYFDYSCAYCGAKPKVLCRDHFVPLNLGGNLTVSNVIPCCQDCNFSKSNRRFDLWYRNTGFYSAKREAKISAYLKLFEE